MWPQYIYWCEDGHRHWRITYLCLEGEKISISSSYSVQCAIRPFHLNHVHIPSVSCSLVHTVYLTACDVSWRERGRNREGRRGEGREGKETEAGREGRRWRQVREGGRMHMYAWRLVQSSHFVMKTSLHNLGRCCRVFVCPAELAEPWTLVNSLTEANPSTTMFRLYHVTGENQDVFKLIRKA